MRTSRDVVRPLVALLVVVAAIGLVSNVAAYRAANTTHPQVQQAGADECGSVGAAADRDGDADRGTCRSGDESRESGEHGGVTVVTQSGAS